MLPRRLAFRILILLVFVVMMRYLLATQWLMSSKSSYNISNTVGDYSLVGPSPPLKNKQTHSLPSIFQDAPVYHEFQLFHQPVR